MTDMIRLDGMEFFGYHGVLESEQQHGQPFTVNLELYLDLAPAGKTDDLTLTVDYSAVFDDVQEIVQTHRYNLLETLAETIASQVLTRKRIQGVRVVVKKTQPPVQGKIASSAVDISRWKKKVTAYLGLGSNLGERKKQLASAVCRLGVTVGIDVVKTSSLYETEPVGPPGQDYYLNAIVQINTSLTPVQLLTACKQIERDQGRRPGPRWGPREIDIDILLYGDEKVDRDDLKIPHPELTQRAFVLVPLAEIAPDLVLDEGTVQQLLAKLADHHTVTLHCEHWD